MKGEAIGRRRFLYGDVYLSFTKGDASRPKICGKSVFLFKNRTFLRISWRLLDSAFIPAIAKSRIVSLQQHSPGVFPSLLTKFQTHCAAQATVHSFLWFIYLFIFVKPRSQRPSGGQTERIPKTAHGNKKKQKRLFLLTDCTCYSRRKNGLLFRLRMIVLPV